MSRLEVICEFSEKDTERIKMFSKVNSRIPCSPFFTFFHGFKDTDIDRVNEVVQKFKGIKVKIAEIKIQNTTNSVMARIECETLRSAFHFLARRIENSHPLHEGKYVILLPLFSYDPKQKPQYRELEGCFDLLGVEFPIEKVRITTF